MKKTIGIFTTIQGHKSIAEAIQQTMADDYEIVVFSETDILFKIYGLFYKYFPFLFAGPFIVGSNPQMLNLARKLFFRRYIKALNKFDQSHKIDLFINTFWMYEAVLEGLAKTSNRPLLNILTDPRTFHPTSIGLPPAVNIAFDDLALKRCQKYYPQSQAKVMGWCIRPEFEATHERIEVRKNLQLPANQTTVLFATGSDGMEKVQGIIKRLHLAQPTTLIVACGHNQQLFEKIRRLSSHLSKKNPGSKLIPLAFTPEIYRYMQASDLVVGKAGPNMLFESVATLTPFMATAHVAGQEDGNLEIILESHLGYVEEDTVKAAELLSQILEHPEQLTKFQQDLEKMAQYNREAKRSLQKLVASYLKV